MEHNELLRGCTGGGRWFILEPEDQYEILDDLRKEHNFDEELIDGLAGRDFNEGSDFS